jgi:hypothetical protein
MNRNSPSDSPSRESPATLNFGRQRSETSALWLPITVPEGWGERNGKLHQRCAKGVERRKFLWKSMEKTGGIAKRGSVPGRSDHRRRFSA